MVFVEMLQGLLLDSCADLGVADLGVAQMWEIGD